MARPRLGAAVLLCLSGWHGAHAAEDSDISRLAKLDLIRLMDVPIVSAARRAQTRGESPRAVSVITREEIRRRNYRNVPEAVGGLTGVFLQQTNYAGGSPIIRGMVGNRILIMIDGVRINNSIYRLGPNQYLSQIDINMVERIEVVRGTGSVLYGSDAFGGVVNVITRQAPSPGSAELAGELHFRYATSDASGAGRAEFRGSAGRWGYAGGYTSEGFGDLRAGGGRGLQPNTGYTQTAGNLGLKYSFGGDSELTVGVMRLRQNDVPRTDVLRAGTDLEYLWNPQGRDMISARYTHGSLGRMADSLQATVAFQRPYENVNRITAASPSTERRFEDSVPGLNASVQLSAQLPGRQTLIYGFDMTSDWVTSLRNDVNLKTGALTAAKGNYADKGRFTGAALFVQDEVDVHRRLHAVLGLRRDWFLMDADTADAATGAIHVHSAPSALTGNADLLFELAPHLTAVAGVAQGFRAPNFDDSTFIGASGTRFEIPNAKLSAERSLASEYGFRAKWSRASLNGVYFEDRYRGLIDRAPALWHGLGFVDANGNGIRDAKELDIYQRSNVGRAVVRGVEAESIVKLNGDLTLFNSFTWTWGQDLSLDAPLSRIPPLIGLSRISWQPHPAVWLEVAAVGVCAQRRLSPGDIADVRIGPAGTPGFVVFHLRGGLNRTALAGLSLSWENITNRDYRMHGSGFERPSSGLVAGYSRSF